MPGSIPFQPESVARRAFCGRLDENQIIPSPAYYLCGTTLLATLDEDKTGMTETAKQRLLVMNGQRLLQSAQGGEWATKKVDKAGALKPGIYDLYLATPADKTKAYDGTILYADKTSVYQKVAKSYIKHDRQDFSALPDSGQLTRIHYDDGKAVVAQSTPKLVQGRGR